MADVAAPGSGAAAAAPINNNANAAADQQQPWSLSNIVGSFVRMAFFWYIIQQFTGGNSATQKSVKRDAVSSENTGAYVANLWPLDTLCDFHMYICECDTFANFSVHPEELSWHEYGLRYGKYDVEQYRYRVFEFPTSEAVRNNGSLYAHMYLSQFGTSPDPLDPSYRKTGVAYRKKLLNTYVPKYAPVFKKNLVTGDLVEEQVVPKEKVGINAAQFFKGNEETEPPVYKSYWNPNLTVSIVVDENVYPRNMIKSHILDMMDFADPNHFYPVVYGNDFWRLSSQLFAVNETVQNLTLNVKVEPQWAFWFQLMTEFSHSQSQTGATQSEMEEMKRVLIETDPYLLIFTVIVSLLHSLFEFLAFKNDIQFWNNRKSMEGLSVRSILINIFFQAVIFLYLLDNETSLMVIISVGIGVLIEMWKFQKAVIVKVDRSGFIPKITFKDRASYKKSKTREYDELAFKYLSYVLFPLVIGYGIYSLMYETHKSWYSWVLGTLVGFVYTFGFITMTPQLFINYKLKSVANMPWKTFMYKTLNTFVDDLFGWFIVKMPLAHRLATLRDDLIFFVYLYQCYIYPVDPKRKNEFGQGGEDDDDDDEEETVAIDGTEKKVIEDSNASAASSSESTSAESTIQSANEPVVNNDEKGVPLETKKNL